MEFVPLVILVFFDSFVVVVVVAPHLLCFMHFVCIKRK
jgi:hypothetical protein